MDGWKMKFPFAWPLKFLGCRIPSGDEILAYTFVGFWLAVGRATGFFVIFILRNFGEVNSERFTMTGFCRIVSCVFPTGCCPHFDFCNVKGLSFNSFTPRKLNTAPKTWWLEEDPLLLGLPVFRCELFRVWSWWCLKHCRILAIRQKILRVWVFLSGLGKNKKKSQLRRGFFDSFPSSGGGSIKMVKLGERSHAMPMLFPNQIRGGAGQKLMPSHTAAGQVLAENQGPAWERPYSV